MVRFISEICKKWEDSLKKEAKWIVGAQPKKAEKQREEGLKDLRKEALALQEWILTKSTLLDIDLFVLQQTIDLEMDCVERS